MAVGYNIEELRKKFNHGTIEDQIRDSKEFLKAMNPGIDISKFPPVDQMSEEEEKYIRKGLNEAEELRNKGKLKYN